MLAPFADYGFNKSHSAVYAILAYQTAFLKANFPAEFMAANLTNEITSVDKLPAYIEEARKMGIPIDPPDINRSDRTFTVVDGRIVYGFLGIKGIGDGPAEGIIRCRQEQPYRGFMDFLDRVTMKAYERGEDPDREKSKVVGKKGVELLIKTGAFDGFGQNRATLLENLERAVEFAQNKKEDKRFGQTSLFEDTGEKEYPDFECIQYPEMDRMERLNIEKELIGFYFSGHPLDDYREAWKRLVTLNLAQLDTAGEGEYTLIGILKTLKPHVDKKGKPMAFGSLMDYNGEIDLVFFEKIWENCRDKLAVDDKTALKGYLDKRRDKPSFRVLSVLDMENLPGKGQAELSFREVHIRLKEGTGEREEALYPLRDYLMENPGPCSVFIHVPVSGGEAVIRTAGQIGAPADPVHIGALTQCAGVAEAWGI
jgi:DNA polymerase-3 subunit alpha